MPIITLTSDFGLQDYYVAMIKGSLLSCSEQLQIIDITHNIKNYDIVQGAFVLKNAYSSFPKGSIHLISVNNFYRKDAVFLAIRHDDHYFVGPDNGIFSLMFGEDMEAVYEITYDIKQAFPLSAIFAGTVEHLISGKPFNEIGIPVESIEERISFQPVITQSQIRGTVIHVDHYENVIVNISKELFDQVRKRRPFSIQFKRHQAIKKLSRRYSDCPIGETLCLFNSAGYLEIAINMGKASSMLGLLPEESVHIDFQEKR
ncbi:MAG: SAM-dependent chlorinase/fluorinase [Bacteroidota bacterium]